MYVLIDWRRSTIEIDTRNPEHPKLNLEVVIDGKVAYKCVFFVFGSHARLLRNVITLIDCAACQ